MSTQTQTQHESGATTWTIDPAHTEIGFAVRHMMITTVRGRFSGVEGALTFDESDPAKSSIRLTVDAASVDTRSEQRDGHLRSADFFDVEKYPTITFESRAIEAQGDGRYRVVGDLTIRGVTREVVVEVEEQGRGRDPWGGDRIGFSATTKLDRTEFGLSWNQALETGGVLVSNEVRLTADVQLVGA